MIIEKFSVRTLNVSLQWMVTPKRTTLYLEKNIGILNFALILGTFFRLKP